MQIEGIHSNALLDGGSQVTLLYRSFYNEHLKHLPLTPIERLEIWGLSVDEYPYDGYLCLELEFGEDVVGVKETVQTLALVCPDPVMTGEYSIIVGTNTSTVRRLYQTCKTQRGNNFIHSLSVHPVIKKAYETFQATPDTDMETKRGTVWFTRAQPFTLPPGGVATVTGKPKFPGRFSSQAVLIERPEEGVFPDELLVMPVIDKPTAVNCRRITVTVRNMSNHEVTIKRGTPITHVFPVDVVKEVLVKGKPKPFPSELSSSSFNFGNSPVPPEWKERLCQEMMKRKEVFSCSEFDVGCAKSTEHTIRVTDDKPFRELPDA